MSSAVLNVDELPCGGYLPASARTLSTISPGFSSSKSSANSVSIASREAPVEGQVHRHEARPGLVGGLRPAVGSGGRRPLVGRRARLGDDGGFRVRLRRGRGLRYRGRSRLWHRWRLGLGDDDGAGLDLGLAAELALQVVEGGAHGLEPFAALLLGGLADPLRLRLGVANDLRGTILGLRDDRSDPLGNVVDDLLCLHGSQITRRGDRARGLRRARAWRRTSFAPGGRAENSTTNAVVPKAWSSQPTALPG